MLPMRAFACQFDIQWEDKSANFDRVRRAIAASSPPPGSLIALPEMFATGFSMNVERVAEPPDGETSLFVSALAAEWECYIVAGVATRPSSGKGLNEALVYDPAGHEVARYVKQQPFTLGGERDHYEAGSASILAPCGPFLVAPLICYDLRFPELFRSAVAAGAQLFVVVANWPQAREAHWLALLRARAIENQAYVVGVNRCGNDPRLKYRGQSAIIDPQGNLLALAGEREQVIDAELDLQELLDYRRKFPALEDMKRRD
jgi:predicted amidohydrolase